MLGRSKNVEHRLAVDFHRRLIDSKMFSEVDEKYRDVDPDPGFSKYLDLTRYLQVALGHYEMVGLPGMGKRSVLDVGSGAGYFPFVCKNLGHPVQALDVAENDFYREMIQLLGVHRTEHRIEPFQALPPLSSKFDVVTAFAICFNGHASPGLWGRDEWEFFIQDISRNHVNPGAMLFLKLNREPNGTFYSDDLLKYFRSLGEVNDDVVRIHLQPHGNLC